MHDGVRSYSISKVSPYVSSQDDGMRAELLSREAVPLCLTRLQDDRSPVYKEFLVMLLANLTTVDDAVRQLIAGNSW